LKQHQQDAAPTEESYQHGAQAEGERDRNGPLLGPRKGEVSLGGLQLSNRRGYLDILSYGLMLRPNLRAERASPRIAVVLTATIDPGETPLLTLRDPAQRSRITSARFDPGSPPPIRSSCARTPGR